VDRIPNAACLSQGELRSLRSIVGASFTPNNQIHHQHRLRLIELGLVQCALGGLLPTPAGRIVSRM
jgi:hypothetical protein